MTITMGFVNPRISKFSRVQKLYPATDVLTCNGTRDAKYMIYLVSDGTKACRSRFGTCWLLSTSLACVIDLMGGSLRLVWKKYWD
jgi:hypothetical protein